MPSYATQTDLEQHGYPAAVIEGLDVDSNDAPKVSLPKAEKPSEALKKANEKIAEAQLARDELAKVAADARTRADAAEAKVAELLKMLEAQTAPPAQPANG